MNRRDFVKILGIGGILPFIKADEVEAAPPPEAKPQTQHISPHEGLGSITIYDESGTYAVSGTSAFWLGPIPKKLHYGLAGTI